MTAAECRRRYARRVNEGIAQRSCTGKVLHHVGDLRLLTMNERLIALDVGDRRIGIAVSDPLGITAQPLETYTRVGYGPDVRHISEIAQRYTTSRILCGLPRNMDGTEGFQSQKVREFAQKLTEVGFTVSFYDERMTTVLAEDALLEADMRRSDRKKKVDMIAAVMILQSYLDAQAAAAQQKNAVQAGEPLEEAPEEDDPLDEDVLELEDEDGNVISFVLSARIRYEDEDYVLLVSTQSSGDIEQDESFIMRSTTDAQGNPCYQSLEDEALIEKVYEAYLSQSEG